jgi:4-hydroxy-tetrahydrodipicolinate reductase
MINVLINGVSGKMGQEVLQQINNTENFSVICGVDKLSTLNNSFPVYTDISSIKEKPDVIIDFSVPCASINILKFALNYHIPVVIATTGFSDNELNLIEEYSKNIPIFKAANMSYEINLMADIVSKLAVRLPNSDIEIIDTHHNNKIDSPSGTALFLADSINYVLNNKMTYEFDRHSKKAKRSEKEIGLHSIRGGSVVGKHTVMFFGKNESFEITHTVESRSIFANGAIKAAEFIIKQGNGLYSMADLVN